MDSILPLSRMTRTILSFLFLLVFLAHGLSQTKISGKITDSSDSTVLPFVSVILYQYRSNKIIDYTQTNADGNYSLEIPAVASIITLKTSRLGYRSYQQDVIIGSDQAQNIALSFSLEADVQKLKEVVISGPIIVKEDTIIYDVEHWIEARDQNLEDVLAKIPGFKISGDGTIQVNGKTINKVLIDGEELTDNGATLITKSISPEDVESIEVRLDEKDNKLKESLLDTREYVVLDIKLKESLNKSLFGKVRLTTGYQSEIEPGGYLNAFSLKKKFKTHLFAEHDRFGTQTISLDQIKNIGAEAMQKIFELPADFEGLTERQEFNKQIFGFKDYTTSHKDIIGFTSRLTLSPSFDLFFGSYNTYSLDGKGKEFSQEFTEFDISTQFEENNQIRDYTTKNKLELRFDKGKVKSRIDLNAVLFKNNYKSNNAESSQNLIYDYKDDHDSKSFYENLFFEYDASKKVGVQLKASMSTILSDHEKKLVHNDSSYTVLTDENSNQVFDFNQGISSTSNNFVSEARIQAKTKLGVIQSGVRFQQASLRNSRSAINSENDAAIPAFSSSKMNFDFLKWTPFLSHRVSLGILSLNNEIGYAQITIPSESNQKVKETMIEYSLGADLFFSGYNYINLSVSKRYAAFPMSKLAEGLELAGFQTLYVPRQNILEPVPEYVINLSGAKEFSSINLLLDPAILYGRAQNSNQFLFEEGSLVQVAYGQLQSEYLALTFPFIKKFKILPVEAILEPEWLGNQNKNIAPDGSEYTTQTGRTLLGLKLKTVFEDKPYDFNLYPKYTAFDFSNELSDTKSRQEMFSISLTSEFDFFEEKLLITPSVRTVTFYGNVESDFTNISLRIESPTSKWRWFMVVDNLLNNKNFVKQSVFPTYFVSERSLVFERYFKFGLEYKFK